MTTTTPTLASRFRHNILQPITAVQTLLTQCQKAEVSDDDRISMCKIMGTALGEFEHDLNNLTLFMQFEFGEVQARSTQFNLQDAVIEAMSARVDSTVMNDRARFLIDDRLMVKTDQALLMAAVAELICNALEYSEGIIEIYSEVKGEGLSLGVRDSGPGVAEEVLNAPQLPFQVYQAMLSNRPTRLGLGLPIAYRIAEVLGGRLVITPRREQGADVQLHLAQAASI